MISAIVLVWRSERVIARCLQSLSEQLDADDEIILVDNGSTDGSVDAARAACPRIRVTRHARNLGVAAGRQSGVEVSRGDMILFLDDDAVLMPGALRMLRAALDSDPRIGVVGPSTVDTNSCRTTSARDLPTMQGKLGAIFRVGTLRRTEERSRRRFLWLTEPADVPYLIGACQLVRASALDRIGGLDTSFFYGPEDADMCLRFWKEGYRCVYLPSAMAIHDPRSLSRRSPFGRLAQKHAFALFRYFVKHRYAFRAPVNAAIHERSAGVPTSDRYTH